MPEAPNYFQSLSILRHLLLRSSTDISQYLSTSYPRYGDAVREHECPEQYHILTSLVGHSRLTKLTQRIADTCRIALMSIGKSDGSTMTSLFGLNWRTILHGMQTLFTCGSPRSGTAPGGGYLALDSMWATSIPYHELD